MSYRADKQKLTDTQIHTHTDADDDNTRRPKGIGKKKYSTWRITNKIYAFLFFILLSFNFEKIQNAQIQCPMHDGEHVAFYRANL